MDYQQFQTLQHEVQAVPSPIHLSQKDYTSEPINNPKTLLYGYDCDRNTHHVYQDYNGFIYLFVYKQDRKGALVEVKKVDVSGDGILSLDDLIPNKRLYPQYCDNDFCVFLKEKGVQFPFTVWEEPKPLTGVWVGEIF